MVRTHGGHQFRPRGQTNTSTRDGTSTSRAAAGHSPAQGAEAPPDSSPATAMMQSPASATIPEESQGAEPPSRRYHTRVGPRSPLLCIHSHHGGPRLPSRPGYLARGSLHIIGLSLYNLQLPKILHNHRLNYPLLRGLGVHYLAMARYPRT